MTDKRRPERNGSCELGLLINRAGKRRYHKQGDTERVIRYVLRQREDEAREDELAFWGACGLPEWEDAKGLSDAMSSLQKAHTRRGNFGRYIDHEIYNFAPMVILGLERHGEEPIERTARKMAEDIYREGFPVVFAGHRKAAGESWHVHFAVGTVNPSTGNKRHEDKKKVREREARFQDIVKREIRRCGQKPWEQFLKEEAEG